MNEVTMRPVLTVHCSGFSWRDLHKFATIFNMPTPLENTPPNYLNKIEAVVKNSQNRGQSATLIARGLNILLSHVSCLHASCPEDSWCRWRQTSSSAKPPPAALTNYSPLETDKIKEVFNVDATEEFCSYLTLGMTQNANKSLHNTIWNLCPKAKYISFQSVTIIGAVAVTISMKENFIYTDSCKTYNSSQTIFLLGPRKSGKTP